MEKYKEFGRPSQISLIIGSGVADLKTLVDYFLPKPSIDRANQNERAAETTVCYPQAGRDSER